MTARSDAGSAFERRVLSEAEAEALNCINFLKSVDVHLLSGELGLEPDLCTRVLEGRGYYEEIHVRLVDAVLNLRIVKAAVDDEKG